MSVRCVRKIKKPKSDLSNAEASAKSLVARWGKADVCLIKFRKKIQADSDLRKFTPVGPLTDIDIHEKELQTIGGDEFVAQFKAVCGDQQSLKTFREEIGDSWLSKLHTLVENASDHVEALVSLLTRLDPAPCPRSGKKSRTQ